MLSLLCEEEMARRMGACASDWVCDKMGELVNTRVSESWKIRVIIYSITAHTFVAVALKTNGLFVAVLFMGCLVFLLLFFCLLLLFGLFVSIVFIHYNIGLIYILC